MSNATPPAPQPDPHDVPAARSGPTRRRFLQFSAALTAAAIVPTLSAAELERLASTTGYNFLTEDEANLLTAMVDVLIPADGPGPSASESGVVRFIDNGLAGSYGAGEGQYLQGPFEQGTQFQGYQMPLEPHQIYRIAMKDFAAWCKQEHGAAFHELDARTQQAAVDALAGGKVELSDVPAAVFFQTLLFDTQCGYFADPAYGANRGMAGWKMVGFPGARTDLRQYLGRTDRLELVPLSLADVTPGNAPGASAASPSAATSAPAGSSR